jgi:hypothetical protein
MIAEGDDMREIPLAEVTAMVPALRPGYAAMAAIESDCFDIDVAALHQGFLRQARAAGGTLALRSRAGRIWRADGAWHAETATGAIFSAPVIVNAASQEYASAVNRKALRSRVIDLKFLEEKDGSSKIISFFAKRARGLLARYAIDNRIERADDLKGFDRDGYRFQAGQSSADLWVFSRPQPAPVGADKE